MIDMDRYHDDDDEYESTTGDYKSSYEFLYSLYR